MKKIVIAFLLFHSLSVLATDTVLPTMPTTPVPPPVSDAQGEIRRSNYQIDWQYKAGEYLIYNCERDHYACVNEDGDKSCRDDRKEAIDQKLSKYPCAALKKFSDKKACVLESYKIVDINAIKRFCYPK